MKQFKCTKCGFQFPYADDATEIQCPSCSMKYGKSKPKLPESVVLTASDSFNNSTDEKKIVQPQSQVIDYETEHKLNQARVLCSSAMKAYGMTELITGILTVAFAIGLFSNLLGLIALAAMGWVRYYVIGVGILLIVVGASNIGASHRIMFASPEVIKNNEIQGSAIVFLLLFFTVPGIPCVIANIIEGRRYDTGLRIMGGIVDSGDFDFNDTPLDNSARKKLGKVVGTILAVVGVGAVVLIIIACISDKLFASNKKESSSIVMDSFKTVTPVLDNWASTNKEEKSDISNTDDLAQDYIDAIVNDALYGTDTASSKWDDYVRATNANKLLSSISKSLVLPDNDAYKKIDTLAVRNSIGDVQVYYILLGYKDTNLTFDYVLRDKANKIVGKGSSSDAMYFGCTHIVSLYFDEEEYEKIATVDWNIVESTSSYYINNKSDYLNNIRITDYNVNNDELYFTASVIVPTEEKVNGRVYLLFSDDAGDIVDFDVVYYLETPVKDTITFSTSNSYNDYTVLSVYYDYADMTTMTYFETLK